MNHLDKNKIADICGELFRIRASITGISGLFEQTILDTEYSGDCMYGLSKILDNLSERLLKIEESLECTPNENNDGTHNNSLFM